MTAIASMILVVTVLATLALLTARVALGRNTAARHAVLVCALLAIAAAPLWAWSGRKVPWPANATLPSLAPVVSTLDTTEASAVVVQERVSEPHLIDSTEPRQAVRKNFDRVLYTVWAIGAALMLVRLARDLVRGVRMVRRATNAGTIDGCRVRLSPDVGGPICVGWFRPIILLPHDLAQSLDAGQMAQVLAHESAHVRRRDTWVVLLQRLVEAAWWFHPLIHWVNRDLDRAREERCDNHVLAAGHAPQDYARTLLQVAEWMTQRRNGPATSPGSNLSVGLLRRWNLRRRVAGLVDERRNVMTRVSTLVTVSAALAFAVMALLTACATHAADPAPPAKEATAAKPAAGPTTAPAGGDWFLSNGDSSSITVPTSQPVVGILMLYKIRAELGQTEFRKGDNITIDKVVCTGEKLAPGEIFIVSGTYTLASEDEALLALYITSNYPSGAVPTEPRQQTTVKRGSGKFELRHVLSPGYPHLSFYAKGGNVGGVYFGQGESVLKK